MWENNLAASGQFPGKDRRLGGAGMYERTGYLSRYVMSRARLGVYQSGVPGQEKSRFINWERDDKTEEAVNVLESL